MGYFQVENGFFFVKYVIKYVCFQIFNKQMCGVLGKLNQHVKNIL